MEIPLVGIGRRAGCGGLCRRAAESICAGTKEYSMEEKMIYSRRYPTDEQLLEQVRKKEAELSEEEKEERKRALDRIYASIEELWAYYQDSRAFVLKEDRVQPARTFTDQVISFCECYEIDVDIKQKSFCVEASLYLRPCSYTKQFTAQFSQLLSRCDRMGSFACPDGPGEFVITMEVDTHDFYVNGHLINDIV